MPVFVGRTRELKQLGGALDRAAAGHGGVVLVKGEAGAGKSSLIQQFLLDATTRLPELRVLAGECSEHYGAGEPYQPFVEAFRALVHAAEQNAPAGKPRLRDLAKQVAPYWLQVIPVAGDLIAAAAQTATELRKTWGGGAATAAPSEEALFFQYTELVLAVAAEQPILLFIDDLHWADQASVSLLAHLGRKIADQRVLILGTYRETDVAVAEHPLRKAKLELERYRVATEIALAPLDASELGAFVREELGAPAEPELLRWLSQRAGSTPLFFGELLRWLVAQGLVQQLRGEWALVRVPEELEIPRTAEAIIEKRLTRLDPELYKIVEYASVFGSDFDSVSLSKLLGMDELELEEALEGLARKHQLIRLEDTKELPTGDFASLYEFSHSLIQHAVHKTVQGKRRILLHRKVAEILEATYAPDTSVVARRLAFHYDEGRLGEKAYAFALRAADASARLYAHWSILEVLQIAMRNAQSDEQRLEVLERQGDSSRLLGRFGEALASFTEALELAERLGRRGAELRVQRKMVLVEREHGARPQLELLEQLEQLEAEARRTGESEELCQILWQFRHFPGFVGMGSGAAARAKAEEARRLVLELNEPALVPKADYEVGCVLMFTGAPDEARPFFDRAAGAFESLGDRDRAGMCHNAEAIAGTMLGRYPEAAESLKRAAKIFDELGDPVNEAAVRNNLGLLLTRIGDWAGAEENLREAVRLTHRMGAVGRLVHPLHNMAELYQAAGDWPAARRAFEELLVAAREIGHADVETIARCGLGMSLLAQGELEAAAAEVEGAAARVEREAGWSEGREAWQLLAARVAAARGERSRARALLEEGETALAGRDAFVAAQFRLLRGEIHQGEDPVEASTIIEGALATFARLGAEPMRARAEMLLARTAR